MHCLYISLNTLCLGKRSSNKELKRENVSQIVALKSFYRTKSFLEFLYLLNLLPFQESWCFLLTHTRMVFKRFAMNLILFLKLTIRDVPWSI